MSNQRVTRAAAIRAAGKTRHKADAKRSDSPPVAQNQLKKVTTKRRASSDAEEVIPRRDRMTGRKSLAAALAKEREAEAKEEKRARAAAKRAANKKATSSNSITSPQQLSDEELPHNLGPRINKWPYIRRHSGDKLNDKVDTISGMKLTESTLTSLTNIGEREDSGISTPHDVKLIKDGYGSVKPNKYRLTSGRTPFEDWPHPTPEECEVVNKLLSDVHGEVTAPMEIPPPSLTVTGCGEVPSVLDALIRTLLSGATTFENAARAFGGLVKRFGVLQEGIGKGSVDWDAVRRADFSDVWEAIIPGGLAFRKANHVKKILDMVYKDNQRRLRHLDTATASSSAPEDKVAKDLGEYQIACNNESFLSLNHLHGLSSEDAMKQLLTYPGVGPKTAACVLLFCLQRPCFAVDTHIFRLSQWLGWVPPDDGQLTVNEVTAFKHLEVRVPNNLKYSLHQLFIRHGKGCTRCRANTGEHSEGWNDSCVIDHLVNRVGLHKPGGPSRRQLAKKNKVKPGGTKRKSTQPSRARAAKKIKTDPQLKNLPWTQGLIDPDETDYDPDLTWTDPEVSDYSRAPSDILDDISD
ncbi:hypothetical protein N7454_003008 [Penicillium verhagenii]|nr:hypothetical protein N7454_003008 [Penicillium verhagenii]